MSNIYEIMAKYYDEMYSWKDYEKETQKLLEIIEKYKPIDSKTLLDVGCGTGAHINHLRHHYKVTGVDVSEEMLKVAKDRFKDVQFFQQNMTTMHVGMKFDIITCLFGAIGHLTTEKEISSTMQSFSNHLNPGGVVIIEPFLTEEKIHPWSIGLLTLDNPDIKVARVNASRMEGNILYLNFHFLIATKEGVEHFVYIIVVSF
ncbi:MAG: class I SAM-dependent methyltransferase [Candidatus Thorarchaeota archaeon]|nr:class I SAM-dependent methyltransferase [Candidatus Thorarchaeota archaeon]